MNKRAGRSAHRAATLTRLWAGSLHGRIDHPGADRGRT